jgi:outer membrane murein-binding lipoprotein Lpp
MEYNGERPHESLNNLTPEEYRLMAENRNSQKVRGTKTGVLTLRARVKKGSRAVKRYEANKQAAKTHRG